MTKLLYITMRFPLGDSETFIAPEIHSISKYVDQLVICPVFPKQAAHDYRFPKNVDTIDISAFGPSSLFLGSILAIAHIFTLRSMVRISITQELRNTLLNLSLIPKAFYVAHRLRAYEFDHIHAHWISSPATFAMMLSQIMGVGYSITAHRIDIDRNNQIGLKLQTAKFIRAIDNRGMAQIRELSGHNLGVLKKIYLGTRLSKNSANSTKREKVEVKGVIAARLVGKKGHKYLLEAIAASDLLRSRFSLDVVGDGPLMKELRALSERLSLSGSVNFLGTKDYEWIQQRLEVGHYDIAVLPSVTSETDDREGIPAFLMEAMSHGLATVTTLNGGIDELATSASAMIVDECSVSSLMTGLETLVLDPFMRSQLGSTARETISTRFDVEKSAKCLLMEMTAPSDHL